jgi:hypothetical protein
MSRLSNKFFTGGVQNRVQSSVRDPGASAFSATTVLPATPTVRPTSSSRRGTTFAGSVAGALPNASPNEQTFGAVQSNGPGRDTFGKRGERAANQDVNTYNSTATAANDAARAAKAAEVAAYEQQTGQLTDAYNTQKAAYEDAYAAYDRDVAGYQERQADIRSLNDRYTNYKFYESILNDPFYVRNSGDYNIYNNLYQQNKSLFDGYSSSLRNQYPSLSHMFTGAFTSDSLTQPTVQLPTAPTLPDAPDPFVNLQQLQEQLPDTPVRRLGGDQREVFGGALPPQVASTTGSTFDQVDVPYKDASQFNAVEQSRLGLPKAYRVNAGFTAQAGNNTSYGGQTFTPDQIGNQTATAYFVKGGIGWIPKSNVTSLY